MADLEGIVFRKLEAGDIKRFVQLRKRQLLENENEEVTCDITDSLTEYCIRHLKTGTFISWVATHNEIIIATSGMCVAEKPPYYKNPTGRIGIISSMYTVPEYRRRGIAKKLLGLAIYEAERQNCGVIQLTSTEQGAFLYESFGFERNKNFFFYDL